MAGERRAGDNPHKIGEGTLTVNGTGVNAGGLKVGDGTVILNQQADANERYRLSALLICQRSSDSCAFRRTAGESR